MRERRGGKGGWKPEERGLFNGKRDENDDGESNE